MDLNSVSVLVEPRLPWFPSSRLRSEVVVQPSNSADAPGSCCWLTQTSIQAGADSPVPTARLLPALSHVCPASVQRLSSLLQKKKKKNKQTKNPNDIRLAERPDDAASSVCSGDDSSTCKDINLHHVRLMSPARPPSSLSAATCAAICSRLM